jgi:hypothetical protein
LSLKKDLLVPEITDIRVHSDSARKTCFADERQKEHSWLSRISRLTVNTENFDPSMQALDFSWAAYHATQQASDSSFMSKGVLLPMFCDAAHSPAMICHALTVVMSAVKTLNPGQLPVVTLDQPLFTIGKYIQWNYSDIIGEHHLLLILGGLHTEMAALKTLGDLLDHSGWTTALVNANVVSAGRSEALLQASHVARTRYCHQVTVAALHILQQQAYVSNQNLQSDTAAMNMSEWCIEQAEKFPNFCYWNTVLHLQ